MKRKKRRRFRLVHLIGIFLLLYVFTIYMNQHKLMKNLQSQKTQYINEVKELENEIMELEKEIENSDSLEFVEKVAREELGMVKPKEIIYIDKNNNKNPFLKIFSKDN